MKEREKSSLLLEYLYGELDPERRVEVARLIQADPEWRQRYETLRRTHAILNEDRESDLPAQLHQAVLEAVSESGPEKRGSSWVFFVRRSMESLGPLLAAGLFASLVLVLTLSNMSDIKVDSAVAVGVLGVISGCIYHLMFQTVFQRRAQFIRLPNPQSPAGFVHVELRRAVLYAFFAFGLFIVTAAVTPNPEKFETRRVYMALSRHLPAFLAYLLPGLFAAVGCFLAGLFLGRLHSGDVEGQGFLMGVLAGVLIVLDLFLYHLLVSSISSAVYLLTWCSSAFAVAGLCGGLGAWAGKALKPRAC